MRITKRDLEHLEAVATGDRAVTINRLLDHRPPLVTRDGSLTPKGEQVLRLWRSQRPQDAPAP